MEVTRIEVTRIDTTRPEFDAALVALVEADGHVLRVNGALENTLAVSRRALQRGSLLDWLVDPAPMRDTLAAVTSNLVATSRFDARTSLTASPSAVLRAASSAPWSPASASGALPSR